MFSKIFPKIGTYANAHNDFATVICVSSIPKLDILSKRKAYIPAKSMPDIVLSLPNYGFGGRIIVTMGCVCLWKKGIDDGNFVQPSCDQIKVVIETWRNSKQKWLESRGTEALLLEKEIRNHPVIVEGRRRQRCKAAWSQGVEWDRGCSCRGSCGCMLKRLFPWADFCNDQTTCSEHQLQEGCSGAPRTIGEHWVFKWGPKFWPSPKQKCWWYSLFLC